MKATNVVAQNKEAFSSLGKCVICFTPYEAPYGRWGMGGTCSKKCETIKEAEATDDRTPARSGARLRVVTA